MPRIQSVAVLSSQHAQILRQLTPRFASLREGQGGRVRVPRPLRDAVLAALDEGLAVSQLCKALGLSKSQVYLWRANARRSLKDLPAARGEPPRVLSVVDSRTEMPGAAAMALEVRLGAWRLNLKLSAA